MFSVAITILLWGCQSSDRESACAELSHYTEEGIVLARDEARCAELLQFASSVPDLYGMKFEEWLSTVLPQRSTYMLDAISSLTDSSGWSPHSFSAEPPLIPCGGLKLTDAYWNTSILSKIIRNRPDTLYISLQITIDQRSKATIRAIQDFNCDLKTSFSEMIGIYRPGVSPITGGWQRLSTNVAEIDE